MRASRTPGEYKVGDQQTVAAFAETKKGRDDRHDQGRGFAGVMKRYGFRGGRAATARTSIALPVRWASAPRRPRVHGLKLPGHMGVDTVTVKNLEVVRIDEEQNLILVKAPSPAAERRRSRPHGVVEVNL